AYKNVTKSAEGTHAGVYYNAYSEDLFVWDNDTENREANIVLTVKYCSLNRLHALLNEENIRAKLKAFKPKYDFEFKLHENTERGIESILFYAVNAGDEAPTIKISRGEERIFVWCFFLALFEVEGWADKQSSHFFIDDPVSSLDDHNIFVTAATVFDLLEEHHEKRRFVITTHHIGLFSTLADWLTKGEKADKFKKKTKLHILTSKSGELSLESCSQDVFL